MKLYLQKPESSQGLVQKVLNTATKDCDSPDVRDRAYIYWRLLSTDPGAAKVRSYIERNRGSASYCCACRLLFCRCARLSLCLGQRFRQACWRSSWARSPYLRVYTTNQQKPSSVRDALVPIRCSSEKEASVYIRIPVSKAILTPPQTVLPTTGLQHKRPCKPSPPVSRPRTSSTSMMTFRTTANLLVSQRPPSSPRLPRQRTSSRGRQATRSTTSSRYSATPRSLQRQLHPQMGWVVLALGELHSHRQHRRLRRRHYRLNLHNNRRSLDRTICWVCSEFVVYGY